MFALYAAVLTVVSTLWAVPAVAGEVMHWGGFPTPAGPVADMVGDLYNIIFIIIAVIGVGVSVGMGWIIYRYRASRGHAPATFSHSTVVELLWTGIPAIICVYIAYISYVGLLAVRTMPENALNVEVVAYQFGWDFFYPDVSTADTHVAAPEAAGPDAEISAAGVERSTKELVIPVGKPVVAHITSQDVIHAFFVPKLGVKIDAMPGRINYVWFQADEEGSFLGQCAELCGSAHGEMFFRVRAVSPAAFEAYMAERKAVAGIVAPAEVSSTEVVSGTVPVTPVSTMAPAL
ncbi:MAG: cytochrome c oxidase subunit II [Alphaproteobacteria bacterium]